MGAKDRDDNVVSITAAGRTVHTTLDKLATDPAARAVAAEAILGSAGDAAADAAYTAQFGQEAPEGYVLSDAVAAVAREVIESDPRFSHIPLFRVGYALMWGKEPQGKGGIHLLARAVKAPALWAQLGVYDVVVWANEFAWRRLSANGQHALLAHELCHIGMNDKGAPVLLDHDVEEFAWVARRYGQWHSGLEFFAEQLGLGLSEPVARP